VGSGALREAHRQPEQDASASLTGGISLDTEKTAGSRMLDEEVKSFAGILLTGLRITVNEGIGTCALLPYDRDIILTTHH
jgi:hypothetical protein